MHLARLLADDPDLVVTRSGVRAVATSAKLPTVTFDRPRQWRYTSPAMLAASLRRRAGISRATRVGWSCQGEYRALHVPGRSMRRHAWHWQLEVALVPGFLVVSGNGTVARFPTSEMILASYDARVADAVRVDLVDGDFVRIKVRQPGELVVRLRSMIWDYDKQFLDQPAGSELLANAEVVTMAEAIVEIVDVDHPTTVEEELLRHAEAERALRLAVLRARRRQVNEQA